MDTGARVGYGYGLHVVSRDNIYTVSMYSVSTEYLHSIYYLPSIYTVSSSTQYLHR